MKIRALRVSELGCFREPVAVEGLSGGLDVLAGANETGKSTLLRALAAIFEERHTTEKVKLKDDLQPYAGGAPLIEVDLAMAGGEWRLRKRYLSGRMAELRNLLTGEVLRNADAESRLDTLLAGEGIEGARSILWVHQGDAERMPAIPEQGKSALQARLAREVSAAATGGALHAVAAAVGAELEELVTAKRDQRRGAFKDATQRAERLARDLAASEAAMAEAETRMVRLAAARAALAEIDGGETVQRHQSDLEATRRALDDARAASGSRKLAEAEWRRLEQSRAAAAAAEADLAKRLAELAQLDAAADGGALALARSMVERLRADALAARQARDRAAAARNAALGAEAAALAGVERHLLKEIAANPVDGARLRMIEEAAARLASLEAELRAGQAMMSVAYERGAKTRFLHAGKPLSEGAELAIESPTEIVVPGIGRLVVKPGTSGSGKEQTAELARCGERLRQLLTSAGVPSAEAARACHERRQAADARLGRVQTRLAALGSESPPGQTADEPTASEETLAALAAASQQAEAAWRSALEAATAAEAQLRQAETDLNAHFEAEAGAAARRAAVLAGLPPAAEREAHRLKLASEASAAAQAASEALLVLDAWRNKEPTPQELARLERAHADAEAAIAAAGSRRRQLELEIVRLEAGLARDAQDGIGERLAELRDQHDAAVAAREAIAARVRALRLLAGTLAAVAAESEAQLLTPVLRRMEPYLHKLWPGSSLDLGHGFTVDGLRRGGRAERPERLSTGTREQLAVLARLGLAALAADLGRPLPVVLDDALVYSDDERLSRLFEVLREAGRRHQVIVLTCRTRTWSELAGNRLRLMPWSPGESG